MKLFHIYLCLVTAGFLMAGCSQEKKGEEFTEKMSEQHQNDKPVANASANTEPSLPVESQWVNYAEVDGKPVKGYLAYPKNVSNRMPGIIVIHEWWGLNDNIEMMTRRLAGEGFEALAVDLYGGETADTPEGARKLMSRAMQHKETNIDNLKQAYAYLTGTRKVPRVGSIGWCFGGGWSLQTALAMPDKLDATVIYYGQLVTDPKALKPLQVPILAFFGGQDTSIPQETINRFKTVLDSLGKSVEVKVYDDANHAFANPSGTRYNEAAATDSWQRTVRFLNEKLK